MWRMIKVAYARTNSILEKTEEMLLKMTHIYTIMNQIVFFTLCDRAIGSDQKINSIYSLMLYNVITYCLQYVRDLMAKEDWSLTVPISEHSRIRHLAMSATSIVLEWTKAVTFIITVVFLVLSFGAKEGLENYHPTLLYTVFTALHYIATEKTFFGIFPAFLARFKIFDSMESLWASVILKTYTIIISAAFAIYQIFNKNYRLAVCGIYINVILCWRDGDKKCFKELRRELNVLSLFRDATARQLASLDDVCSVCLFPMTAGKVTPCNHIFHGDCLRLCLKTNSECPMCKSQLLRWV